MARGDSAHQLGLVRPSQEVSDCIGGLSRVRNYAGVQFGIPKIGDVFACGARAKRAMAKWMLPRDSAHRVGLVSSLPALINSSDGLPTGEVL